MDMSDPREDYQVTSPFVEDIIASQETNVEEIEAKLNHFVISYRGFAKQTASSYICMCKVAVEAEETLPKQAFDRFCKQVELDRGSPTHRKIKKIGESADRLLQFDGLLPHHWTTLYQLAITEPDELRVLKDNGVLHPDMTAADLRQATSPNPNQEACIFRLDATTLPPAERLSLYQRLEGLRSEFAFKLGQSRKVAMNSEGLQ
jgi:hypothetical protein